MLLSDFSFELPPELIASHPLKERSKSRLLCLNSTTGHIQHQQFSDIVELLQPNDLLVCNNTRVIPARLMGKKATGGQVEVLIERILDQQRVLAHVRASKSPQPGSLLSFANAVCFEVLGRQENLFELRCQNPANRSVLEVIEEIGQIPIPPYFHRQPDEEDKERYQTVFAKYKGSVAAPTAGLHFDETIFQQLTAKGVQVAYLTLHIGSGTFAPVRVENIEKHHMHAEYIDVSAELCDLIRQTKAKGGRVIAVGTTSARSLETAARSGQLASFVGDTDIFIYPGYEFKVVDALVTNFHLPSSTLLMLVCALGGYIHVMAAYQQAIELKYRFFSYGDAMFISKPSQSLLANIGNDG